MSVLGWIKDQIDPLKYVLSDVEFDAVYDWISAYKDDLPENLKKGLLKLLNGEEYRRTFPAGRDLQGRHGENGRGQSS